MSILNQYNQIAGAVISNGAVTGNEVQTPDNLLNTTDSTAIFGATSDVLIGNFPFNLPLNAVIVGISGIIKARIDNNSVPPGSLIPSLKDTVTGIYYPTTPVVGLSDVLQEYDIGGEYDIWGNTSWTPTKLNNMQLQLLANSSLEVAWASMTVFYYIPQTTAVPSPFALPGCDDCDSEIQALPFELAQTWLSNTNILILKSFNLPNGDPITLDMLGDCGGTINVTIDPDLRKEDGGNFIENFNIDSSLATITNLANGYVQIDLGDITQRGLGFDTPYGHDLDNVSEHSIGAVVIITNNGPYNSKLLKRCHIGTLVSAPIDVLDEGNTVAVSIEKLNFIGDNVQAEQDSIDPRQANVTVVADPTNVEPTEEDTATGTNNTTPSLTLTVPLTIVSANYLRVAVVTEDETITGVTYNGVAMTLIGEQVNPGVNLKVALFGLINPAVGAHNVVVTMPTSRIITAIVTSWLDVDTTSPTDGISAGAIGSNTAPTDSVTTTTDNTIVQDVVGTTNNPTTFAQYGLWSIQGAVTTGIRPGASSSRRVLAPQSVTDTYGLSLSTGWAILLAGIRGISNTPPGGVQTVTGTYIDNTDPVNPVSVVPLNNTDTVAPTVNDDETLGYAIDSKWFDSVTGTLYTCEDATTGAAVWTAIVTGGPSTDELVGATATDTTPDFLDPKLNIHSSDSSVSVVKTITNPAGNEIVDYDLTTTSGGGTKIAIDTTQVTVDNTAVQTNLYTVAIPGGTLGTNNAIRFRINISDFRTQSASSTFSIRVVYGGVDVIVAVTNLGTITDSMQGWMEGYIIADGATNTQKTFLTFFTYTNSTGDYYEVEGSANVDLSKYISSVTGTGAIDSTVSQNLEVDVQWNTANAGSQISVESIIVEKIS